MKIWKMVRAKPDFVGLTFLLNLLRQILEISKGKAWFCRIDNLLNLLRQIWEIR